MAKDFTNTGRIFSSEASQQDLAKALANTPEDFALSIDTNGLTAVVLPEDVELGRLIALGADLLLIQEDGTIVVLLGGAQNGFVLQVDGVVVPALKLKEAAEKNGDWTALSDVRNIPLFEILNPDSVDLNSGEQEQVNAGDPLIGLPYSPLLPPTDYVYPPRFKEDYFGDKGGTPPGDTTISIVPVVATFETDTFSTLVPAQFIQFDLEFADLGEEITEVTLSISGLPLGTATSAGQLVGGVGSVVQTLQFTGTLAEFEALTVTFPTDFSTESRTDFPAGPLDGQINTATNFLGSQTLDFPVFVFPEGDVEIDDTLPDTVPDETDAPTLITPASLLLPRVTDIDGSEALETLVLTVQGLPGGSDLASLGIVVPAGATATLSDDATTGAATQVLSMDAANVADIEAEYAAFNLTLPADFSTANRSDLTNGSTALPLSVTLDVQTDEDQFPNIDTPTDGTATATRIIDIAFEEDIELDAPFLLSAQEDDGVFNSDQGVDLPLQLQISVDDQDGSETANTSDPRFAVTVDVEFSDLPAGTTVNGGQLTGNIWTGSVAQAEALVLSLPGNYSGSILNVVTVNSPEGSERLSQAIIITPTPDIEVDGFVLARETDADVEVLLSDFIDVVITDPSETLSELNFILPQMPAGIRVVDGSGTDIPGAVSPGPSGTVTVEVDYDAATSPFTPDEVRLIFPTDYSSENPQTTLEATLTVTTIQGGIPNVPVTAVVPVLVDFEGDVQVDDAQVTLQETDAAITFRPVDSILPVATDIDGSESLTEIAFVVNDLPSGTRVSEDGGSTLQPAGSSYAVLGSPAAYADLVIELPRDFSTENPATTLFASVAAVSDEGGFDIGRLDITVDFELDVVLTAPPTVTAFEDGNGLDGDGVTVALGISVMSEDIDGSEDTTFVEITFIDMPDGVIFSSGSYDYFSLIAQA